MYNPVLAVVGMCNTDLTCLSSSNSAWEVIIYCSNYVKKAVLTTSLQLSITIQVCYPPREMIILSIPGNW